jgi:hypothetical protein
LFLVAQRIKGVRPVLKRFLVCALIVMGMIASPNAQQTERVLSPNGSADRPTSEFLASIVIWLSENFDLPATSDHPRVELIPQARMAALRFRDLETDRSLEASPEQRSNVIAVYDSASRTIYLQQEWRGSPAEVSVLVHEMVHHLQTVAGLKYECPQAREKSAYAAQEKWLSMYGLNLMDQFEINPMAVFVRSSCFF